MNTIIDMASEAYESLRRANEEMAKICSGNKYNVERGANAYRTRNSQIKSTMQLLNVSPGRIGRPCPWQNPIDYWVSQAHNALEMEYRRQGRRIRERRARVSHKELSQKSLT